MLLENSEFLLTNQGKPSPEALKILSESPQAEVDRSAEKLPELRAKTKSSIEPAVERAIIATQVSIKTVSIAGVECLEVLPNGPAADWTILYCFGGGFVQGSPFEDLTIAAPLCAVTGAKIIIPNYRLAPEHPWPAAVDDGFSVYQELSKQPFALVGESAGGNLALSLMLSANEGRLNLPHAAALLSPWCDLSNSGDSQEFNNGRDPTLTTQGSKAAARHYVGDNDPHDPLISPINGTFSEGFPPCMITTGTRDLLLSQAVRLAAVLRNAGVQVDLHVWEGLWHVFEWDDRLPEAKKSISEIALFLNDNLSSGKE